MLRFVFAPTAIADDHVIISDGMTWRRQPKSSAINQLLDQAGASPIVHVTGLPPGWTLEQTVAALCGSPAPGESPIGS